MRLYLFILPLAFAFVSNISMATDEGQNERKCSVEEQQFIKVKLLIAKDRLLNAKEELEEKMQQKERDEGSLSKIAARISKVKINWLNNRLNRINSKLKKLENVQAEVANLDAIDKAYKDCLNEHINQAVEESGL